MKFMHCRFTELTRIMNMSAREPLFLFKGMKAERVTGLICDKSRNVNHIIQNPSLHPSILPHRVIDGQLDHQLPFISNILY